MPDARLGSSTGPGVLVIRSWWGLTEGTRALGRDLAAQGFRVVLADLFDGRTASTEEEARVSAAGCRGMERGIAAAGRT